jgi:hypothetical protein
MVDGGLLAGFGVARGGPAIVMYDLDGEVLLQFAEELRDDLIAAGIVQPAGEEAEAWEEPEPADEITREEGLVEEPDASSPEYRWGGHYLARPEYREALKDFATYVPIGSAILDIGCGTGTVQPKPLPNWGTR